MKKQLLASFAILALAVSASAQEFVEPAFEQGLTDINLEKKEAKVPSYKFFNHLGIGVHAGLIDGVGVSAALPVSPYFQIRGGYSIHTSVTKVDRNFDFGNVTINGKSESLANTPIFGALEPSFYGLLDIYPSKKGAFHFTVGMLGSTSGDFLTLSADLTGVKSLDPSDYGTLEITLEGDGQSAAVTTDFEGKLQAGAEYKNKFNPYFGIGFGRGANIKHRVSFSFDIGAYYYGGMKVYANNYYESNGPDDLVIKRAYLTSAILQHKDSFAGMDDLIDQLDEGKILGGILPVIKFGLNIRLF